LFTNQIDMGATPTKKLLFNGEPMYLVITVTEAFVGSGATVNFRVRSDLTASIHATESTGHVDSGALAMTALDAIGDQVVLTLPPQTTYERFLGLQCVTAGATTTAGQVEASIKICPPPGWVANPDAIA
jgi:hypothetical protein